MIRASHSALAWLWCSLSAEPALCLKCLYNYNVYDACVCSVNLCPHHTLEEKAGGEGLFEGLKWIKRSIQLKPGSVELFNRRKSLSAHTKEAWDISSNVGSFFPQSSVVWPVPWALREKNYACGIMQHSEIIIGGQCNIMFIIWTGKYGKTKCNSPCLVHSIPAPHFRVALYRGAQSSSRNSGHPNCCLVQWGPNTLDYFHLQSQAKAFSGLSSQCLFFILFFTSSSFIVVSLAFLKYF